MTTWTNGIWQNDAVSVLGVARSQPGDVCFPPLGASCHVRSVTLLRLPDNVPHGERESQGTERDQA